MSDHEEHESPSRTESLWRRLPAECVLVTHLVICVAVLVLAPRGFPVTHPRFWLLLGFPVLVLLLGGWGLTALLGRRAGPARWSLLVMSGGWLGLSLTARVLFSESLGERWAPGGVLAGAALLSAAPLAGQWRIASLGSIVVGLGMGVFAAYAVRSPEATTAPLGLGGPPAWESSEFALRSARSGQVHLASGDVKVVLEPLLGFDRISPDRFLSLVAPPPWTRGMGEIVGDMIRFADGAELRVAPEGLTTRFIAATPVEGEVFTHLNTYARLSVSGCDAPWVRFSPCPGQRVEVCLADYPVGRPARFACLEPGGRFSVFEASSGEKGPFTRLASGPLRRGEPLTAWFGSGDTDLVSLRLDDWSAQLSTELSPTAGWGVPQNAIEFQIGEFGGSVEVWVTLAATSVGRGWDTVGHRAGVYLNRGELAILAPESGQDAASVSE